MELPVSFLPVQKREIEIDGALVGRVKRHAPAQVVTIFRQVEVSIASRKTAALARKEAAITEQTYYHWHKEYGVVPGLQAVLERVSLLSR